MRRARILSAQEVGKENLFIFGMDAEDVPVWREGKRHEWADYDPRFAKALDLIKSGTFGDKEYFQVAPALIKIAMFGALHDACDKEYFQVPPALCQGLLACCLHDAGVVEHRHLPCC
jgi:glucan phosphorylase